MFKSLCLTAVLLCSLHVQAQQFSLRGLVRDSSNHEALAGATIQVENGRAFAITDDLGRFELTNLQEGSLNVIVRHLGFHTESLSVIVPSTDHVSVDLRQSTQLTEEVLVYATRATSETPTTFTNVNKPAITRQNFGQDLPYLLNWTPSVVTTSDAGTGFGYTGLRIRGSDATSINVTINGIPYNDAESLGTFWVDIPDIASSAESIQIQRGVGTSTNGAGAFGATVNLQTATKNNEPYATLVNSVGVLGNRVSDLSYNSRRHTIGFGTGLIDGHWTVDGRLSRINSEGFIDRATAKLSSYYLSAGYFSEKTIVKALAFGGKERTYQAWYGVPESRLKNNEEAMLVTAMNEGWNEEQTANLLASDSRTFNPYTYENQVDDYQQDHYQLHVSQQLSESLTGNVSIHYTPGRGYYEEYKPKDSFADYGLDPVVIGDSVVEESNIIRRRWLDNDFYGATFSLNYSASRIDLTLGGGANRYSGKHFGEIIWSEVSAVPAEYDYYNSNGEKNDFNLFAKINVSLSEKVNGFVDLQGRAITYSAFGLDNTLTGIDIDEDFTFFNPKAGVTMQLNPSGQLYTSVSIANREPVRSDFINAPQGKQPKHETLYNLEAGYRFQRNGLRVDANYYYMLYKDQLIHTGMLNDVGSPIRTNVEDSYRMGIELQALAQISPKLTINGNATFSQNRIDKFTEVLYDYGANWDEYNVVERNYQNTTIAFSPSLIAGAGVTFKPVGALDLTLLSKYVSRQYLDNTSNKRRSLDPYLVNDLRVAYTLKPRFTKEITVSLLANNLFNEAYESNGYTWGYLAGPDEYRENYYYPQAGRSYLLMLAARF